MVQTVQGGACQAAGKQPGEDFSPAPHSFFLGTHSGERALEGHLFLESWNPLEAEELDLLCSWEEEEREK